MNSRRVKIRSEMEKCRQGTLKIFAGIDNTTLCTQADGDFSPIGWHLGHIAYTEELWLLGKCAGMPPLFPEKHQLWAADGLPKSQRQYLPPMAEIIEYLNTVRSKVFEYLQVAALADEERLWWFLLQHESQHCETIAFVQEMHRLEAGKSSNFPVAPATILDSPVPRIEIPAGEFEMGADFVNVLDNERSPHRVYLETYSIDPYPATCKQYSQFMKAVGYGDRKFWSPAGWEWLQANPVDRPLYWSEDLSRSDRPVCGVSYYEAEAYCNFVGKRLPTEAEWEKAASWDEARGSKRRYPWGEGEPDSNRCNCDRAFGQTTAVGYFPDGASAYGCGDMLGNVWEWTASWFDGYDGFEFFPYRGYSQTYFDGKHRVLKGGSWATRPWALRCSFRNWYYPEVRQIFAGFRCAL